MKREEEAIELILFVLKLLLLLLCYKLKNLLIEDSE